LLSEHAHEHVERLMLEFRAETRHGLRCWLLELIGEAQSPQAFPLLLEYVSSDDDSLRGWAIRGLKKLNTKEARRALWEAGSHAPDDSRKG
jgi:HEAT repeat protein